MHEWLEGAAARLVGATGNPGAFALDDTEIQQLLDLARDAAHGSDDRTNAPLVCYLVGLARGRHPDMLLADLIEQAAHGG